MNDLIKQIGGACQLQLGKQGKYVLLKISVDGIEENVIRMDADSKFHDDVAAPITAVLDVLRKQAGGEAISYRVVGGGRINCLVESEIEIFGHSIGFPWPGKKSQHEISAEVARKHFPLFTVWSDPSPDRY